MVIKSINIDPGLSAYFDLLRIVAAMTVFFSHYLPVLFGADADAIPGHDAVIVFFVLSGYVIAYVAEDRDRPASRYAVHRLARLWSVLIPSLCLSLLAATLDNGNLVDTAPLLNSVAPAIRSPLAFISAAIRTALFMGENWFGQTPAPYNAPVWSLNYEAWYYAVFAAFSFAPKRWRWPLSGAVLFAAGPGVIALFPCWLLGAWLFWNRRCLSLAPASAYALFAGCVVLYAIAYHFRLTLQSRHWLSYLTSGQSYHLRAGTSVIGDLLLAPLVAGSIFAVENMPAVNRSLIHGRQMMKRLSSRTLSIYLFHMPLLAIFCALGIGQSGGAGGVACLALGIGTSVLLGNVSEARLSAWRSGLFWLYRLLRGIDETAVKPGIKVAHLQIRRLMTRR